MTQKILQKNMILVGIIFCVTVVSYQYFHTVQVKYLSITTFKECADAGFKIISSYPEKCVMSGKSFINELQNKATSTTEEVAPITPTGRDFKNTTYIVNNDQVILVDGKYVTSTNQQSVIFEVVDKQLFYDINNDNKEDVVFLLKMTKSNNAQEVYYITSAIGLNTGYSGTNALYVDTNLKSSAFVYKNGAVVLGYTTNDATSTLKEKYFIFTNNTLKQISYK